MAVTETQTESTTAARLEMRHRFAAPCGAVFAAWTEAAALARWCAPPARALTPLAFDLRPGGIFHWRSGGAAAPAQCGRFIYLRAQAPVRLDFIVSGADLDAEARPHPRRRDWPLELACSLRLEADGDGTQQTLQLLPLNARAAEQHSFVARQGSLRRAIGMAMQRLARQL